MWLTDLNQAGSLFNLAELIVEEELCINLRGRMMHCSACSDSCPSEALNLTPDSVDVDEVLCTGCCSCLPSCPAGALRSSAFIPERFVDSLTKSGHRDLHCRFSEDRGGGIIIPCHGVLDARLLAAARGEGVTTLRLHGLNRCGKCEHGDMRAHIQSVITQLEKWLGEKAPHLDLEPQAERWGVEDRDYQDQPHMDRRTFLHFGGAKSMAQTMEWLLPGLSLKEQDREALPFFQSDDYPQRQSAYQQTLVDRADRVPWLADRLHLFRMRHVTESCSVCLSCGERCPTGALWKKETAQVRTLSYDPAACTDCGLCVRICPENAIQAKCIRDLTVLMAGRGNLIVMHQHSCRQCGSPFVPTTTMHDLCPHCSNEQALDEEWLDILSG